MTNKKQFCDAISMLMLFRKSYPKDVSSENVQALICQTRRTAQRKLKSLNTLGLIHSVNKNYCVWQLTEQGKTLLGVTK